ncbi:MAG TPA: hypothetical protein DEP43_01110 [Ruminococcaceae bacterium]|nr:hypothetical protein [Oscillospiraceae bacterium]
MVFHGENSAGLPCGISCGKTGWSSAMGTPVPVQKSKCQKKRHHGLFVHSAFAVFLMFAL